MQPASPRPDEQRTAVTLTMHARPLWLGLCLAVLIVAADQISKAAALDSWFFPPRMIELTPFLNLVAVWNSGVSFGFLAGSAAAMPYILASLAGAVTVFLVAWLFRTRRYLVAIALGCVIGGAVGNVIDRLRFHAVVDFIDLHVAGYHWPAFNLADSTITIGVGLLLLDSFGSRTT